VYEYQARLRHADGTYRWGHVKGFGVERNAHGRVTRVVGARVDITQQKEAEEEIRQLNQELEQRVQARTAELEAANRELEAFSYSVSHDLRAPLRHVDGFLQLLEKRAGAALDQKARHYMEAISDAAGKMGRLIDDLLSFSRTARQAMLLRDVNLATITREVVTELEAGARGRKIDWHIGDLPTVSGDAPMLRLVMMNLISNALKFTRTREQAIVEVGSEEREGEIRVFVRDNGVGFDQAYAEQVFDVFQRLHRADEFEGTGVGLAIVQRIISRHGGRVRAEGKTGEGATLSFYLPRRTNRP
jgi:light-regulated signal transduction histidine kinase (bacteriophytochrome)